MSITTKTGDKGTTVLACGERVSKSDMRVHCVGLIEETIAWIEKSICTLGDDLPDLKNDLWSAAKICFLCGSDTEQTNAAKFRITAEHEQVISEMTERNSGVCTQLRCFGVLSRCAASSDLNMARITARHCERELVRLYERSSENFNPLVLCCINRLSDFLFLAVRTVHANTENFEDIYYLQLGLK